MLITINSQQKVNMIRIPTHRAPTHPGEMLLEEFLNPMHITQRQLADAIHVPYQRVNEIINGRRGVTPATALRLAKFFGMIEIPSLLDIHPVVSRQTKKFG